MDDQTAIDMSKVELASIGWSTDGLSTHVHNPAGRHHEVAFAVPSLAQTAPGGEWRVFMFQFGWLIGVVRPDGAKLEHGKPVVRDPRLSELERVESDMTNTETQALVGYISIEEGEDVVDVATRYLVALGINVEELEPRVVEPPRLVGVTWWSPGKMGGGYEVYFTDTGVPLDSSISQ